MPSGDYSRPPHRKTVNKGKAKTKPAPNPVAAAIKAGATQGSRQASPITRPLAPSFPTSVAPKRKPVAPKPLRVGGRTYSWGVRSPASFAEQERQRAARARAQQVHGAARRDVKFALGVGPRRTVTSVGFAPSPIMPIGPVPNAIAAGAARVPIYRGRALTPQQITRDITAILRPGGSRRKGAAVERLQVAGVVDPFGTTTRRQGLEAARRAFLARYRELEQYKGPRVRSLSDAEIMERLKGRSRREIESVLSSYQPESSGLLTAKAQTQLAGFDPRGLLTGAVGAFEKGRELIQGVAGNNVAANLAADALYLPIGLVGGAALAASDPKGAWEGLKHGAIGSLVQGDTDAAERALHDHPLFSVLEFMGAKAAVGRTAGAAARTLTGGRVAGLARDPIALYNERGGRALYERGYSKDAINQIVQRAYDRRLKRGPVAADGRQTRLLSENRLGREVNSHLVNRFADVFTSRVNSLNRLDRETNARIGRENAPVREHRRGARAVGEALDRALPSQATTKTGRRLQARFPGLYRPERDVVTHAIQGLIQNMRDEGGKGPTVETFRRDLKREQQRIMREAAKPDTPVARRDAALDQVALIQMVLDNPKALANWKNVIASAEKNAARLNEQQRNAIALGLEEGSAGRAPLFPFAQARMGAQYGKGDPGPELQARIDTLKAARSQAKSTLRKAETVAEQEVAQAAVRAISGELRKAYKARGQESLRTAEGLPLPNAAIKAQMRREGINPDSIAYLTHQPNSLGARAFYRRFDGSSRQNLNSNKARTGKLFEQGATEYRYNHIIEQMVSHGTKAVNAQQIDQLINEVAIRGQKTEKNPDGLMNREEFNRVAERMEAQGTPVRPIVAFQAKLSPEARARIKDLQEAVEAGPDRTGLLEAMWEARVQEGMTSGARNLYAIPSRFLDRLDAHLANSGNAPAGQALTSAFRQTVLPFSTKWMFGNIAEGVLRAAAVGTFPLWDRRVAQKAWVEILRADIRALGSKDGLAALARYEAATNRAGRRAAIGDMERAAPNARAVKAELLGMLFYGNRGLTNTRQALGSKNETVQDIAAHPATQGLKTLLDQLTRPSFAFNRRFEMLLQEHILGKHLRQQIQEFSGSWWKSIRAEQDVLQQVSKGLMDTPKLVRAAKYMDETLGRYSRFSPMTRKIIQQYAPFLPWYLASARFTFLTLPGKHPIKFAVLTSVERAFQEDWVESHKDLSPEQRRGSLSTAIPHNGGFIDAARYTPVGIFGNIAAGDLGEIASPILPQAQGIIKAFGRQDPFGSPLRTVGEDGKLRELTNGEHWQYTLNTIAETFLPLLGLGRRLQEGGQTSLPTSTALPFLPLLSGNGVGPTIRTKPSSSPGEPGFGNAIDKVFNVGRPIYLRKPRKGSGASGDPLDAVLDGIDLDAIDEDAVDAILEVIG